MIPLNLFTLTKNNVLVTEASTLVGNGFNVLDTLVVKSPTGRTETFYFASVRKDDEDEVVAWTFQAINPQCRVQRVTIFND